LFVGPRVRSPQPPLVDCFRVLRRFSTLAAWSVAGLAAGGALNTWFMTNGLRSFFGTEFTPRLLPTNVATEEDTRPLRLLCASVSLEIALGLVVICVVAVLGQLPPPGHEHHMD
jgi:putative copper export protein